MKDIIVGGVIVLSVIFAYMALFLFRYYTTTIKYCSDKVKEESKGGLKKLIVGIIVFCAAIGLVFVMLPIVFK